MTTWLPEEEAAQLRSAFEAGLARLEAATRDCSRDSPSAGLTRKDFLNLL